MTIPFSNGAPRVGRVGTRLMTFLLLVGAAMSATIAAQTQREAQVGENQSPARLADLDYLAGHCWRGTFPDSSATDTHCYSWRFGRAFLRDSHAVIGRGAPYYGETVYAWDRASDRLGFWYFNSTGDVSTGHATRSGTDLVFPETITDSTGRRELQTVWTREGRAYRVLVRERKQGVWREVWRMTLRRLD